MSAGTMKRQRRTFTVQEAAEKFGKDESRIRQILRANKDIGDSVAGRIWILTKADMDQIGKILAENGRSSGPRKKSGNPPRVS